MKPYYQENNITIYHGDCREIMPQLEPVDLVLTDPPYNVGIDYGSTKDNREDYEKWCFSWFDILQSNAILMTIGIANLSLWLKKEPRWVLAWIKSNSMRRITIGFNCWEPICLWGKPSLNSYRDIVEAPIIPQNFGHPTPKPFALFKKLVIGFSETGQTILDPFIGSGTTLVAAKELGRKAIGIEIEEKYCEIAVHRLRQEVFDF